MNSAYTPSITRFTSRLLLGFVFFGLSLAPLAAQAEAIYKYINSKGEVVFTDQPVKGAKRMNIIPPPVIPLTPINLPPSKPSAPSPEAAKPASASGASKPSAPLVPSMQMQPLGGAPTLGGTASKPAGSNTIEHNQSTTSPAASTGSSPRIIRQPLPAATAATPPQKAKGQYQSLTITEPKAGPVSAHAGGTIFVQTKLKPGLDLSKGDRMRIVIDGNTRVDDSTGQRFMISDLPAGTHSIIAIVMRKGKNIVQSNPVVIQLSRGADSGAQK